MKKIPFVLFVSTSIFAVSGCKTMSADSLIDLGSQAVQVATLSNQDIKTLSDKSCAEMDASNKIEPVNSAYTQRLNKITASFGNTVEGTNINYKVYLTKDVNAWAMANGCVRVYSGLMDMMTDNEIQGILGHELGHIALGHSRRAIQVAYSTEIARGVIAASGNETVAALSQSQLGDLAQAIINSQFSQKQETAADNFSFDYLTKKGINPLGLATAFEKLGGESSLLSSHPASSDRSKNIRDKIARTKS